MLEKRVLVLCDNVLVYRSFIRIVEELKINGQQFSYYCSPSSAVQKKEPRLKVLDLKSELDDILGNFDLAISLHCQQLFPRDLLKSIRCVNVHPGFNPCNRGWYPQVFSSINKLPYGVTIHEIDEKIDHGNIICQMETPIHPWDTSKEMYERNLVTEYNLLKNNLLKILSGEYTSTPPEKLGNYNSKADFLNLNKLDLNQKATYGEFINHLRGVSHGEYKNAYFITANGEKVFVKISLERNEQ